MLCGMKYTCAASTNLFQRPHKWITELPHSSHGPGALSQQITALQWTQLESQATVSVHVAGCWHWQASCIFGQWLSCTLSAKSLCHTSAVQTAGKALRVKMRQLSSDDNHENSLTSHFQQLPSVTSAIWQRWRKPWKPAHIPSDQCWAHSNGKAGVSSFWVLLARNLE